VTENPYGIEVIFRELVYGFEGVEQKIKNYFEAKRHRGEWFRFSEEDVLLIKGAVYSAEKEDTLDQADGLYSLLTELFAKSSISDHA